jgi:hypothetical protein
VTGTAKESTRRRAAPRYVGSNKPQAVNGPADALHHPPASRPSRSFWPRPQTTIGRVAWENGITWPARNTRVLGVVALEGGVMRAESCSGWDGRLETGMEGQTDRGEGTRASQSSWLPAILSQDQRPKQRVSSMRSPGCAGKSRGRRAAPLVRSPATAQRHQRREMEPT